MIEGPACFNMVDLHMLRIWTHIPD